MPPKLTALRITPSAPVAEVGAVVTFKVAALYVNGRLEPITTCRWTIDSGGGSIGVTTGKYVARTTPGTAVIRATHPSSGMYALATVTAAVVSGGQTDPPPAEEPPPPLPPLAPTSKWGLFGWNVPIEEVGGLFTTVALGLNSRFAAEAEKVAAKGGKVIVRQGAMGQTEGQPYSEDHSTAWIQGQDADYLLALWVRGVLVGIQMTDDFMSPLRWPANGRPSTLPAGGLAVREMSRIGRVWAAHVPGIPLGHRARPRQFTGEVPQEVGFVTCQYRYWGGLGTPAEFVRAELALADARGWDIAWSNNWLDGGSNVSGVKGPMTVAQLKAISTAMVASPKRRLGIGGWKYDPAFVATAGMRDVLLAQREAVK
ncbi:MAG: hypothetical protein H0V56_08900 [Chthoniobacterales bacterium]|nr:hypothetical protein [Chthoniobacterales bacterium]